MEKDYIFSNARGRIPCVQQNIPGSCAKCAFNLCCYFIFINSPN